MSETQTVTGSCAEISERGDWTTFHIDVGRQYPVKLSTKLAPLVELGRAASKDGGQFVWTYTEQESENVNEHTGKPYVNRYLSSVSSVGEEEAPTSSASSEPAARTARVSSPQDGMTPEKWDAKERRDYRSRAWAQTISALTHTIKTEESAGDVYRRLYALQRMIYRDIVRELDPEAHEDDDVPF